MLDRLLAAAGTGSAMERAATLRTLMAEATEREQAFIAGVLLGELRTGALEGVLMDAVARAADRPADAVRRAAMLSGDLGGTALLAITGTAAQLDAVGLVVGRPVQPMLAATAASAGAGAGGHGGSVGGIQARRRTHPGAPCRRRRAHLHPHPGRGDPPAA